MVKCSRERTCSKSGSGSGSRRAASGAADPARHRPTIDHPSSHPISKNPQRWHTACLTPAHPSSTPTTPALTPGSRATSAPPSPPPLQKTVPRTPKKKRMNLRISAELFGGSIRSVFRCVFCLFPFLLSPFASSVWDSVSILILCFSVARSHVSLRLLFIGDTEVLTDPIC